jgi:ankyrin repeat protein
LNRDEGIILSKQKLSPMALAIKSDDDAKCLAILDEFPNMANAFWLHNAAQNGAIGCAKVFVSQGVGVNESTEPDRFPPEGPLFPAVMSGNLELVRWLLEQGATSEWLVPGENAPRNFALSTAVSDGRLDMVQLLVEHGANVNVYYGNRTPVSEALAYGHKDIADYLCSKGGKTPEELGVVTLKKGRK